MNKRLLTEMTDEELMELESLLVSAENALKQKKPLTEDEIPEAKPVYQIAMAEGSTSTAWIDVAKDVFDDAGMYPEYKRRALYTRPEPSRKPMTDREICDLWYWSSEQDQGPETTQQHAFARAIEKHHGIGGGDE